MPEPGTAPVAGSAVPVGSTRWSVPIGIPRTDAEPYGSAVIGPVYASGIVAIATHGRIIGYDAATGAVAWSCGVADVTDLWADGSTIVAMVGSGGRPTLVGLSISDGSWMWTQYVAVAPFGREADGVLLLGRGSTSAVELSTGLVRWTVSGDNPGVSGSLVATIGSAVQLVDLADGRVHWSVPFAGASPTLDLTPTVVVTSSRGELTGLAVADGHQLWTKAGGGTYGGGAFDQYAIFSDESSVEAIDAATGALAWRYSSTATGGAFKRSRVMNGWVIASGPGSLVVLDAKTGTRVYADAVATNGWRPAASAESAFVAAGAYDQVSLESIALR